MSYKCEACGSAAPKKAPRLTHIVHRADGTISREIAVCRTCHHQLERGTDLDSLMLSHRPKEHRVEVPRAVDMVDRHGAKANGGLGTAGDGED